MTVSTFEELAAALLSEESIAFGASIEAPSGEMLTIPKSKNISIDLKGFEFKTSFDATYTKNKNFIKIERDAILTIMNGTVIVNGEGDGSYAFATNNITVEGGSLIADNVKFVSNCAAGITSCIDINTASTGAASTATVTNCSFESKRYGVRLFSTSATQAATLIAKKCKFTGNTGPFVQNGSSNVEAKSIINLTNCSVDAKRGLYIWDANKNPPSGDPTIEITLNGKTPLKATATADPAGDAYLPGYSKEIMVDYSSGQHADRVKVIDQRIGYNQPFSATYKNKYKRSGRVIE